MSLVKKVCLEQVIKVGSFAENILRESVCPWVTKKLGQAKQTYRDAYAKVKYNKNNNNFRINEQNDDHEFIQPAKSGNALVFKGLSTQSANDLCVESSEAGNDSVLQILSMPSARTSIALLGKYQNELDATLDSVALIDSEIRNPILTSVSSHELERIYLLQKTTLPQSIAQFTRRQEHEELNAEDIQSLYSYVEEFKESDLLKNVMSLAIISPRQTKPSEHMAITKEINCTLTSSEDACSLEYDKLAQYMIQKHHSLHSGSEYFQSLVDDAGSGDFQTSRTKHSRKRKINTDVEQNEYLDDLDELRNKYAKLIEVCEQCDAVSGKREQLIIQQEIFLPTEKTKFQSILAEIHVKDPRYCLYFLQNKIFDLENASKKDFKANAVSLEGLVEILSHGNLEQNGFNIVSEILYSMKGAQSGEGVHDANYVFGLKQKLNDNDIVYYLIKKCKKVDQSNEAGQQAESKIQLVVVPAEVFENAMRQCQIYEYELTFSNYFPRNCRMFVSIPVYKGGFINRRDTKDRRHLI